MPDKITLPRFSVVRRLFPPGGLPAVLVMMFSLAVTYFLWAGEQQNIMRRLQTIFDNRVLDYESRIKNRIYDYEQLLAGVSGLFAASASVGRNEFAAYAGKLHIEKNFRGIRGICFLPIVPLAQKDRHVAAVRKEGFPDYKIHPGGAREFFTPILYAEPFTGLNRIAFGSDSYADPVRRAAMEQARDSGQVAISGKMPLRHKDNEPAPMGFQMYMPVYKNGAPVDTLAARRAAIAGWLSAVVPINDFMIEALGDHAGRFDAEIYDGDERSHESLMYDSDAASSHISSESNALFKGVKHIGINGHRWTLGGHSLPDFDLRVDEGKQQFVARAGIATSLLLALLVWVLVYGRESALRAARELNLELTERRRAEEGLRLTSTVFNAVGEAVLVTDPDNNIVTVNLAFTAITGYAAADVIGRNPRILSSGRHDREFFRALWESLLASGAWQGEMWDRRKNGELYVKWLSIRLVRDERGRLTHHVAIFSDISERKAAEEHIQHLAHHDVLTDLPNRTLFADRLGQALSTARRDETHLALMFLDLDKFKPINDTLGHMVGDLLLQAVAERIQDCVRESDTAARLGGDEFVVLLPVIEAARDAAVVAEKILRALNLPFELAGHSLHISSSIGIAVYPGHGSDEASLLRNADTAMYYAKKSGRNNLKFYQPDMQDVGQ